MKLFGFDITRPKIESIGTKINLPKADMDIIMKLVQEFKDRSRKDVQTWKTATDLATDPENPRWYAMQDLFDYLLPDGHLGSQMRLRRGAVRCTPFIIRDRKNNKVDQDKTDLLKDEWFFNLMGDLLDSIYRRYTLVQFVEKDNMNYKLIPRRNVDPILRRFYLEVGGDKYIDLADPVIQPTIVMANYGNDYGILHEIARDLIWKKNSRESWAEFSEKFGIPLVTATASTRDKTELKRIDAMMKALGEAATAILPLGSTITIHDSAAKGDPYKVYLEQINLCNAEISKAILGGTMLSDNGSSKSQSEVHERGFATLSLEDKIYLEFIVNKQVLPIARLKRIAIPEGFEFAFDRTEKEKMIDAWTVVAGMIDKGYEIEIDWLKERFNVPVTGRKETTPAPSFKPPVNALALALAGKGINLPKYKANCGHSHSVGPHAGFVDNLLSDLSDQLINDIFNGKETLVDEVLKSIRTHNTLLTAITESWEKYSELSYDAPDHQALAAMEYNLFEFSRTKELANVAALNNLLLDGDKVKPFNQFKKDALQYLYNPDVNWLKTEYNHAIAVGQNASRYISFKSEADTVTQWVQWQTVGDSRVRAEHAIMDGRVFDIKEKGGITMWPPKDWGCRCEMIQYLGKPPEELKITNDEARQLAKVTKGSRWDVNRGDARQVFTANEMYAKSPNYNAEINKLTYEAYGKKAWDDIKKDYPTLSLDKTITSKNAGELFKPVPKKDYMGFTDYLGRKLILREPVFTRHTTEKKYVEQERHQMFAHIKDILQNPDEVYFFKHESTGVMQTRYIKFYDNDALIVNTDFGTTNVEINTWHSMNINAEKIMRRGYLIKTKKP